MMKKKKKKRRMKKKEGEGKEKQEEEEEGNACRRAKKQSKEIAEIPKNTETQDRYREKERKNIASALHLDSVYS